jgi:hypothetical protein
MDINLYNKADSKLDPKMETYYLHPFLLLADTVKYCSVWSEAMMLYQSVELFNDNMAITIYKQIKLHEKDEDAANTVTEFEGIIPLIKKVKKRKHKSRQELILMMDYKKMLQIIKDAIRDFYSGLLTGVGFLQMEQFYKDEIWLIDFKKISMKNSEEDDFIAKISEDIINREFLLSLDYSAENIFSFSPPDDSNNEYCDFIKIPLWYLPPFIDITYEQMKYTREQLIPLLEPFDIHLTELNDLLKDIMYNQDSKAQIALLCQDKIIPHFENVQKNIDESLYLCKMKNKFPEGMGLRFCLGVTSNDNLVNFYERAGVVEPYMANEIKQRISRHTDLNSCNLFCYFELLIDNKSINFNE